MAKLTVDENGVFWLGPKRVVYVNEVNELTLFKETNIKNGKAKYSTWDRITDKVKNRGREEIGPNWYQDFTEK